MCRFIIWQIQGISGVSAFQMCSLTYIQLQVRKKESHAKRIACQKNPASWCTYRHCARWFLKCSTSECLKSAIKMGLTLNETETNVCMCPCICVWLVVLVQVIQEWVVLSPSTPQHLSSPFLLLVLSDRFLLLLDSSEFKGIRSVSSWDDVALGTIRTADLTTRSRWFVNVSARRAGPTLCGSWVGAQCFSELRHL